MQQHSDTSINSKARTGLDAKVDTALDAKVDTALDAKVDTALDAKVDTKVQVLFTLDGRPLVTAEKKMAAAAVLRLGGLDPAGYDLAEVRHGHAEPKRYADEEQVTVSSGDAFVSIRQKAEVA